MVEHGADLRAEVRDVKGGEEIVRGILRDYRQAPLSAADRAMLDFAVKLTKNPRDMGEEDIQVLRGQGFSDVAIHDIVQIASLFNYYNRLAEGLGVEMEPEASGAEQEAGPRKAEA